MAFSNKRKRSVTASLERALAKKGHQPFTVRELMRDIPAATRASIDMALSRMAQAGEVRRLDRGVYDVPEKHVVLGTLPADPVQVAHAVARAQGAHVVPSGKLAASQLGISQQVPSHFVFRTTGASKRLKVGNTVVDLRHSQPGRLRAGDNETAATLIEALRELGQSGVSPDVITSLRSRFNDKERHAIAKATPDAPAWMQRYLRELVKS